MKVLGALGFVLALAVGLFVFAPWTPTGHPVNTLGDVRVDLSFILAMPAFLERKLQFGTDLVFTYGPLGVLSGNVVPEGWWIPILAARGVLAALFVAAWWAVTKGAPRGVRALGFVDCVAFAFLSWEQFFWIAFPTCGALLALRGTSSALLVGALAIASGAIGFVKFNFFLVSAIGYGVVFALTLLGKVRQKWVAPLWATAVVATWLALGQEPLGLPRWIAACLDLSAGYGEAMAKGFFAPYDLLDVACVAIGSLLVVGVLVAALRHSELPRLTAWGSGAIVLALVFVSQRHAWGGNQLEQAVSVLAFLAFVAATHGRLPRVGVLVGLTLALFWFAAWRNCLFLVVPPKHALEKVVETSETIRRISERKVPASAEARERAFDAIRAMFPEFAKMRGTADALPDQGAVLLAYPDVVYTPRPAYLSLNAHTERLVAANAAFFAAERAPQNLLYEIVPPQECVHRRLPASLDGLALRTILQRYRLEAQVGPLAWLVRDERPAWRAPAVSTGSIAFGERVPIPPGAVLWVELAIRKTALGALVDQLYKLPHVEIRYHGEGREESWQILPRVAEKGFFVAPRLAKTKDVLDLQRALEKGEAAADAGFTSFEVRCGEGPGGLWQPRAGITLETWR